MWASTLECWRLYGSTIITGSSKLNLHSFDAVINVLISWLSMVKFLRLGSESFALIVLRSLKLSHKLGGHYIQAQNYANANERI